MRYEEDFEGFEEREEARYGKNPGKKLPGLGDRALKGKKTPEQKVDAEQTASKRRRDLKITLRNRQIVVNGSPERGAVYLEIRKPVGQKDGRNVYFDTNGAKMDRAVVKLEPTEVYWLREAVRLWITDPFAAIARMAVSQSWPTKKVKAGEDSFSIEFYRPTGGWGVKMTPNSFGVFIVLNEDYYGAGFSLFTAPHFAALLDRAVKQMEGG